MTAPAVVRYYDHGYRVAVWESTGSKWCHLIPMHSAGIRCVRVPVKEQRDFTVLEYSLPRACRRFLSAGRRFGITRDARRRLRALLLPARADVTTGDLRMSQGGAP